MRPSRPKLTAMVLAGARDIEVHRVARKRRVPARLESFERDGAQLARRPVEHDSVRRSSRMEMADGAALRLPLTSSRSIGISWTAPVAGVSAYTEPDRRA